MKKLSYICSDDEECISELRKLSEDIDSDQALVKTIRASGGLSESVESELLEIEKRLAGISSAVKETGRLMERISTEFEENEERIKLLIRKKIFQQSGNIIVERSLEQDTSDILLGHTLKHGNELTKLMIGSMAGDGI